MSDTPRAPATKRYDLATVVAMKAGDAAVVSNVNASLAALARQLQVANAQAKELADATYALQGAVNALGEQLNHPWRLLYRATDVWLGTQVLRIAAWTRRRMHGRRAT